MNTIDALQSHYDKLRAAELERARRLLACGTPPQQVLERLAQGLTSKVMHAPMQVLNQATTADRAKLVVMLHRIHQLPDVDLER